MSNLDRIKQIKTFLNATPKDEFLNFALAIEYVSLGDFDEALLLFKKLLVINPDYFATYYHLGKLYEKIGQPTKAQLIYEKGLDVTIRLNEKHANRELRGAYDELMY